MFRNTFITLAVLCWSACDRDTLVSSAPYIEVTPIAVDFGSVPVGLSVNSTVQVRNLGRKPLSLQPVTVTESGFSGPNQATTVGPGQKLAVDLTFTPSAEGNQSAIFHFLSDADNDPDVEVSAVAIGVPRNLCGMCNTPPADTCISSTTRLTHAQTGTCGTSGCEYQSQTIVCGISCDSATGQCLTAPDTDGGTDAGTNFDAGTPLSGDLFTVPGEYQWTVPAGVTSVTIKAWGGGGAGGAQQQSTGGGAAFGRATLPVTPGEVLTVQVAEGGLADCLRAGVCRDSGNGGGASLLLRGSSALLIVAGGGGGGSDGNSGNSYQGGRGGAGGGLVGQNGQAVSNPDSSFCQAATGGKGATQSAGGQGGTANRLASLTSLVCAGQNGDSLHGGDSTGVNACTPGTGANGWHQGGGDPNGRGGGGGSGFFGGGGAGFIYTYCAGGGGGGSSFVIASATSSQLISGTNQTQGNEAESMGAGRGGDDAVATFATASGAPGRVQFIY